MRRPPTVWMCQRSAWVQLDSELRGRLVATARMESVGTNPLEPKFKMEAVTQVFAIGAGCLPLEDVSHSANQIELTTSARRGVTKVPV